MLQISNFMVSGSFYESFVNQVLSKYHWRDSIYSGKIPNCSSSEWVGGIPPICEGLTPVPHHGLMP